jgi:hypothetical protein
VASEPKIIFVDYEADLLISKTERRIVQRASGIHNKNNRRKRQKSVRQNLQNGVGYEAMQGVYRCHMNKAEQLQCLNLNKQERFLVVELLVVTILLEFSQKSDQFYLVPSQNRLDLWRFVRIRYEDLRDGSFHVSNSIQQNGAQK